MTRFFYIYRLSLFPFHRGTLSGCNSNQLSSHTKNENVNPFLPAPSQCFSSCHIASWQLLWETAHLSHCSGALRSEIGVIAAEAMGQRQGRCINQGRLMAILTQWELFLTTEFWQGATQSSFFLNPLGFCFLFFVFFICCIQLADGKREKAQRIILGLLKGLTLEVEWSILPIFYRPELNHMVTSNETGAGKCSVGVHAWGKGNGV